MTSESDPDTQKKSFYKRICFGAAILGGLIAFLNSTIDLFEKVGLGQDEERVELVFVPGIKEAISGYQPVNVGGNELFPEGIAFGATLSTSQKSDTSISVTSLSLNVSPAGFKLGNIDYSLDPKETPGMGPANINCWNISLRPLSERSSAWWITLASRPQKVPLKNLLDANSPQTIQLGGSHQDTADLRFNIGLLEAGVYQLHIKAEYVVLGQHCSAASKPIYLVKK